MSPANGPRASGQKLLVLNGSGAPDSRAFGELAGLLEPGDLLVVNDAATFPASLRARAIGGGSSAHVARELELRLLPRAPGETNWQAVLLGAGDWRARTEDREAPPRLEEGAQLRFDEELTARVVHVSAESARLVRLRFSLEGAALWRKIYALGRPIQYSYLSRDLDLWDVQTLYGARPWASEMPSAGRPLSGAILEELRRRGVELARLTHSTGISSSGDAALDRLLPLPEFFEIPLETVEAVRSARARGSRVIAVGTSVVRALEGQARNYGGELISGFGRTDLKISREHELRWVDGILSGIHEIGESHFGLLEAFAPRESLEQGLRLAERESYLLHEFGDSTLILRAGTGRSSRGPGSE